MGVVINIQTALGFTTELRRRFGREASTNACSLLEQLSLPMPRHREYVSGKESLHVFLQQQALLLRFGQPATAKISDRVLQPFHLAHLSPQADFEMLPGIQVGCPTIAKAWLKAVLAIHGEKFPMKEMVRSNIGSLQLESGDHFLVIDRCAVQGLQGIFARHAERPFSLGQCYASAPKQADYFGELPIFAYRSFINGPMQVNETEKNHFFGVCETQAALPYGDPHKRLFNTWIMPGIQRPRQVAVQVAAHEYGARR